MPPEADTLEQDQIAGFEDAERDDDTFVELPSADAYAGIDLDLLTDDERAALEAGTDPVDEDDTDEAPEEEPAPEPEPAPDLPQAAPEPAPMAIDPQELESLETTIAEGSTALDELTAKNASLLEQFNDGELDLAELQEQQAALFAEINKAQRAQGAAEAKLELLREAEAKRAEAADAAWDAACQSFIEERSLDLKNQDDLAQAQIWNKFVGVLTQDPDYASLSDAEILREAWDLAANSALGRKAGMTATTADAAPPPAKAKATAPEPPPRPTAPVTLANMPTAAASDVSQSTPADAFIKWQEGKTPDQIEARLASMSPEQLEQIGAG